MFHRLLVDFGGQLGVLLATFSSKMGGRSLIQLDLKFLDSLLISVTICDLSWAASCCVLDASWGHFGSSLCFRSVLSCCFGVGLP